ncbi:hypothetical protein [Spirosoma harenae]
MNLPESDLVEPSPPVRSDEQDKLRELTSQSWNLEMLISGAALFATLSLPEFLDSVLTYYRYNLVADSDYIQSMMPVQVMGLIKGVSYLLFVAFLIHFVMRAFWVGLLGLLAVYPDGIRFDTIYNLSQYARKRFAQEMGSLPDYIIRLDRRCNVIFALAFSLVLLFLGVAAIYALSIFLQMVLHLLVPDRYYQPIRGVFSWLFGGVIAVTGITMSILNMTKFRDDPRYAPISFQVSRYFSFLFLGLYQPLLYIVYTFYSQIPKDVLKRRLVVFFTIFVVAEMLIMSVELFQTLGLSDVLDSRSFISTRNQSRTLDANAFDNLRAPDDLIDKASIQGDVIREPYVKLFLSYPKSLDAELTKRYKEPSWPDSLSRKERREQQANWYGKTFETYFGVYLNDSLYKSPGLLFTKRADNGQRGLTTILLTANLKTGRNLLKIMVPDSANKPTIYYQIPFWYVPEN